MKNQNSQDERVVAQRRKIQSDAFGILFFMLLISTCVQQFILDAPFEQYAVEFICFLGMSIYLIVRNLMLGLNLFGESKRAKIISLVNSIVAGTTATAIHGVLNYSRYAEHYENGIGYFIASLAIFFISVTLLTFIVLSCFAYLNKKKQAKIEKQLDDDEENE